MALIKTTAELQKYMKVNKDLSADSLIPYVEAAQEKYMIRYLGEDLLYDLDAWYDVPSPNIPYTNLLPHVQRALAQFAVYLASADWDIQIGQQGFQTISSGNNTMVPASTHRVERFNKNREQMGYDAIEVMLRFLEKNKADYPDWVNSPAYTWSTELLIPNAEEFDKLVSIAGSRLQYMKMRPEMKNIEILELEARISKAMLDTIKLQAASSSLNTANEKVYPLLKMALANLTAAKCMEPTDHYRRLGDTYVNSALKIMLESPADYPEFESSPQYDPGRTEINKFDNDEAQSIFVFGSGKKS